MKLNKIHRFLLTCTAVLFVGILLLWEHFNGGVKTHYMLHREDLPSISNYWSLLVVAILSWITLYFVRRRIADKAKGVSQNILKKIALAFLVAFLFGIALGALFLTGFEQATNLLMLGLLFASIIFPLYKVEYLLGYVLGLTFAVGATLPAFFGLILICIFTVTYKLPRWAFSKLTTIKGRKEI
jgi:hypothetical protein